MARKIPLKLMATWLLIVPHVLSGLASLSAFFYLFFNAPFGTQFLAGTIVNMIVAGGAAVSCAALFDPGPFRGAIKTFWSRIIAVLWNILNGVWLGYLVNNYEGDKAAMLIAQFMLAVITLSVLLIYAVEDDAQKTARKAEKAEKKAK